MAEQVDRKCQMAEKIDRKMDCACQPLVPGFQFSCCQSKEKGATILS